MMYDMTKISILESVVHMLVSGSRVILYICAQYLLQTIVIIIILLSQILSLTPFLLCIN